MNSLSLYTRVALPTKYFQHFSFLVIYFALKDLSEIVVHIGSNDVGKKRKEVLQFQ